MTIMKPHFTKQWILSVSLVFCLLTIGCQEEKTSQSDNKEKKAAPKSEIIQLTQANFEKIVLKGKQPVLVNFHAEWCSTCKMLDPVIEELAVKYKGRVIVGNIDVDEESPLAEEYMVYKIPVTLLFNNGDFVIRMNGAQEKKVIADKLDELLESNK